MLLLITKYFHSTFAGCTAVRDRLHMRQRKVDYRNLFVSHSSTKFVLWRSGRQGWTSLTRKQPFVTCILGLLSTVFLVRTYCNNGKHLVFHPTALYCVMKTAGYCSGSLQIRWQGGYRIAECDYRKTLKHIPQHFKILWLFYPWFCWWLKYGALRMCCDKMTDPKRTRSLKPATTYSRWMEIVFKHRFRISLRTLKPLVVNPFFRRSGKWFM